MKNHLSIQLRLNFICLMITVFFSSALLANPIIPIATQPLQPTFTPSAPNIDAASYILMDAASGRVLAEKNADMRLPPASLTKLMSLYIISMALKNGQIRLTDKVRVSTKAWKTEGSRMFVKAGEEVTVKKLLEGIIVASGNDATVALAEYIAGTEEAFTAIMNQQAKLLSLKNSHFTDSTGLPHKDHFSTARDLALLTQSYIKNFPEDYNYYAEKWFTYHGIRQPNRNRLLWRYQYADGLKTGHTSEAGFCLVASAKKDGMRLISVVMGEPSDQSRTEDSIRLMTYGFRFFETHKLYNAGTALTKARIWQGSLSEIPLGLVEDFYVTVPTGQFKRLQTTLLLNNPLKAPIEKGELCGKLETSINNQVIGSAPLISLKADPKGNIWRRASDSVKLKIHKYFLKPDDKMNTG
mgnify:CR=1 FL=1